MLLFMYLFSMVYNYTYSKHNETLLDGLSDQRQNQSHFCDITIKTRDNQQNEVVIFGHKCVLATTSDHLNSIINMEENQSHNLEYDMSTIADAGKIFKRIHTIFTIHTISGHQRKPIRSSIWWRSF